MAKKDMKHHYTHDDKHGTDVPELQGKAKTTKQRANPIIAETKPPAQKVWHNAVLPEEAAKSLIEGTEKPVSEVYPVIDNDLARDNLENDIPEADLNDLV